MKIQIKGWVVVPPISPWDEKNRELIVADVSFSSFGRTPVEAWKHHIGPPTRKDIEDRFEFSRKVQFWFGRGYRLREATMEIYDDLPDEEHDERGDGRKD